jgi:hypothetical protein
VTRLRQLGHPGLISGMVKRFLLLQSHHFGCEGVPSCLLIRYQRLSLGVNQLGHVVDLTSKVWNEGRYNLHFLYVFMACTGSALQSFLSRTLCVCQYKIQSCPRVIKPQNKQACILAAYTHQKFNYTLVFLAHFAKDRIH